MEIILGLLIILVGLFWYYNRNTKSLDVNKDGKVDSSDAQKAVENVVSGVKTSLDTNKDGKVDVADVAVVAEKAKTVAKKTATKAKTTAKKATTRKPRATKASKTV